MKPASPKMGTPIAVYVVFSACLSLTTAFTPSPPGNPYANLNGQPCDPPFGYTRRNCGSSVLLSSTSEPAPLYKYGPNVCRVVNTYQLNELEYTYQSSCSWVYSYYQYRWVQQCQLVCRPTRTCLANRNVSVTRASFECCEGFTNRPASDPAYNKYYFNFYYNRVPQEPEGCRIAVAGSLLECLEIQNLTSFISYLNRSTYLELLNTTGATLTVFAPTNAAFAAMSNQLIGVNPNTLAGNHIVNATILSTQLRSTMRFQTVAQTTLHSTAVVFYDRSLLYTNPHYLNYYHQSNLVRTRSERFINGAQIVNDNACKTPNGTLHIVNRVLMPGTRTIAQIIRNDPRFSNLTTILDAVGVLPFLNNSDISRTLFAPTDDVFGRQFPPELINCLTVYMRRPLNDIALFHIAEGAEYNTSLALRQWQYTLLLRYLRVHAFANGSIFLGTNLTEIVVPNIPAQNGVIHIINGVLLPPNFSFGMCQRFVPTPPPTTPPPMTLPPTTPLPSTPPPAPSPSRPPSLPTSPSPSRPPSLPTSTSPLPVPTPMARPIPESGGGGGVQGAIEDEEYYYY